MLYQLNTDLMIYKKQNLEDRKVLHCHFKFQLIHPLINPFDALSYLYIRCNSQIKFTNNI